MLFLVDGHHLAHRWWHITQDIDDAMEQFLGDLNYLQGLKNSNMLKDVSQWVIVWEHQGEWIRSYLDPNYRIKRTRESKLEESVKALREASSFSDEWQNLIAPFGWEAKDAIASICKGYSGRSIIYSAGKDVRQCLDHQKVVILKELKRSENKLDWMNHKHFFEQFGFLPEYLPEFNCLVGANDINPCPGIGEKTAVDMIKLLGGKSLQEYPLEKLSPARRNSFLSMLDRYVSLKRIFTLADQLDWPSSILKNAQQL